MTGQMIDLAELTTYIHPLDIPDFDRNLQDQGAIIHETHVWPYLVKLENLEVAEVATVAYTVRYHLED